MKEPLANPRNLVQVVQDVGESRIVVPEFQRSYVWGRQDIEDLLTSVLEGYFIGTFLTLTTRANTPMFPFRLVEGLHLVNLQTSAPVHQSVECDVC